MRKILCLLLLLVLLFHCCDPDKVFEKNIKIADRAYKILTEKVNFPPEEIIIDPNILAIATGISEHNNYGVNFIKATEWIKANLPGTKIRPTLLLFLPIAKASR